MIGSTAGALFIILSSFQNNAQVEDSIPLTNLTAVLDTYFSAVLGAIYLKLKHDERQLHRQVGVRILGAGDV